METTYFKFTYNGGSPFVPRFKWSFPTPNESGEYAPGEWTERITGRLEPCSKGYHLAKDEQFFLWYRRMYDAYIAEKKYITLDGGNKVVCHQVRLIKPVNVTSASLSVSLAKCILDVYEIDHSELNVLLNAITKIETTWDNEKTDDYLDDQLSHFLGKNCTKITPRVISDTLLSRFGYSEYGENMRPHVYRKICNSIINVRFHDTRGAIRELPTRNGGGYYTSGFTGIGTHWYGLFRYYVGIDKEINHGYSLFGMYSV